MRLFEGTPFDIPPQCDHCGLVEKECRCTAQQKARIAPHKQRAVVSIEKRAKGKIVTVIRGLSAQANDLPELVAKLKAACGAGGSIDADTLEIQGDHADKVRELLRKMGYRL
ncbi:MAG: translation initiation factor [Pirellula sp.]